MALHFFGREGGSNRSFNVAYRFDKAFMIEAHFKSFRIIFSGFSFVKKKVRCTALSILCFTFLFPRPLPHSSHKPLKVKETSLIRLRFVCRRRPFKLGLFMNSQQWGVQPRGFHMHGEGPRRREFERRGVWNLSMRFRNGFLANHRAYVGAVHVVLLCGKVFEKFERGIRVLCCFCFYIHTHSQSRWQISSIDDPDYFFFQHLFSHMACVIENSDKINPCITWVWVAVGSLRQHKTQKQRRIAQRSQYQVDKKMKWKLFERTAHTFVKSHRQLRPQCIHHRSVLN